MHKNLFYYVTYRANPTSSSVSGRDRTGVEITEVYTALCSSSVLFGDIFFAVAVVVCVRPVLKITSQTFPCMSRMCGCPSGVPREARERTRITNLFDAA